MGNCTVTLKIGSASFQLEGVDPDFSIENLTEVLKTNPELLLNIQEAVNEYGINFKTITSRQLEDGIVPNANLNYLKGKYPTVVFPDNLDLQSRKVLVVSGNFTYKHNPNVGVVNTPSGKVAIIKDTQQAVYAYAKFLAVESKLEELTESDKAFLSAASSKLKLELTPEEMLLSFLSVQKVKNKLKDLYFDGKNALQECSAIYNKLADLAVSSKTGIAEVDAITLKNGFISYEALTNHAKEFHPEFIKENGFVSEENIAEYLELLNGASNVRNFSVKKLTNNGVTFDMSKYYKELKDTNNMSYGNIGDSLDYQDEYKGWHIYKLTAGEDSDKFIVDHRYLSLGFKAKSFNSLEEAKVDIDRKVKAATYSMSVNSKIGIKQDPKKTKVIKSSKQYEIGDIVTSLNIQINPDLKVLPADQQLLAGNYTEFMDQFKKKYNALISKLNSNGYDVVKMLDSVEVAETFMYLMNQFRSNSAKLQLDSQDFNSDEHVEIDYPAAVQAIEAISKASNRYFIVTGKIADETGKFKSYNYLFEESTNEYKLDENTGKPEQLVSKVQGFAETLKDLFGVDYEFVSKEDLIDEQFAGVNPEAKAFILGGKVYINLETAGTDAVVHEYAHLLLGTLKVTNPELYMGMVSKIKQHPAFKNLALAYKGRDEADIYEEVFVRLFSEYLTTNQDEFFEVDPNTNKVRSLLTQRLPKITTEPNTLSTFLNGNISTIFGALAGTLFDAEGVSKAFDLNTSATTRIASNIIENLLNSKDKDLNLKQNCK